MSRPRTSTDDHASDDESFWKQYLKGWTFRSATPAVSPGDEHIVFVSRYDDSTGENIIHTGDTQIRVENEDSDISGKKVRIRVTDFDANEHLGHAEVLEVVGEATY
jgi:hypothetical protein